MKNNIKRIIKIKDEIDEILKTKDIDELKIKKLKYDVKKGFVADLCYRNNLTLFLLSNMIALLPIFTIHLLTLISNIEINIVIYLLYIVIHFSLILTKYNKIKIKNIKLSKLKNKNEEDKKNKEILLNKKDYLICRLEINEYKNKDKRFYMNLSEDEKYILREYKILEESNADNDLITYFSKENTISEVITI